MNLLANIRDFFANLFRSSNLRSRNLRLNIALWGPAAALVFLFGAAAPGQTIGSDVSDGTNTAVTVKHVLRPERVQYNESAIQWFYQKVKLNNADDTVIIKESQLRETARPIATFAAQTATINGVTLTGQEWLDFGAKFGKNNWQADHPNP